MFVEVIHPKLVASSENSTMGDNGTFLGELPSVLATSIAAAITTVATVVGLVGNVLVIAAVTRKKNLRTRGNAFIVSLSTVGLLYVSFVLIPGIDTLIRREWRMGDFVCAFHTYYTLAFSLLSLLHTMCIGLDRVVNVVFFTRARRIASGRNIGIAIALCWLVSLATMTCYHFFVVNGKMLYLPKALRCIAIYNSTSWRVSISVYCFIFILPSIIIVASYVVILVFVRKKRKILMSNMTSRLAPSHTMATSITTGETQTRHANDRVTFAPTPTDQMHTSPTRRSHSISVPAEKSAGYVTKAGMTLTAGSTKGVSQEDGTGNAELCVADHQTPSDADLPGQVKNKSYSATTINVDFPLSDDEQNAINTIKPSAISSSNSGDVVSRSNEQSDSTHECKTVIEEAMVADELELETASQGQQAGNELEEHDEKSVPNNCRKGRRGTIWPTASGRERFSEIAKTFGRARDRLRPSKKIRNDRDLNRMMLAVFVVVWIGYIPYPLVRYLDVPSINVSSNVYMVVTVTMYVAGCLNPIIYGFMHRRFKAAFIEMLTLGRCKASNRIGARGREESISGTDRSTVAPRPT